MAATRHEIDEINAALKHWRQGDVTLDVGLEFLHLADLSRALSPASQQAAESITGIGEALPVDPVPVLDEVPGVVVLSQSCPGFPG